MTLRGRATIGFGILLVAIAAAAAVRPAPPAEEAGLPAVSAGPEELSSSLAETVLAVPEALLAPPVGRGALPPERVLRSDGWRIEYTLDPALTRDVWEVLDERRVGLGHVIVMDPRTGAVLAYVSTDPEAFSPERTYPAASLVKVVTSAAALDASPSLVDEDCVFQGNPWRLRRSQLDPPKRGSSISMQRALATSNNQCFAQWAVHRVGRAPLLDALDRFGLLTSPAPLHAAGRAEDPGDDAFALGRLGSGLDGLRITPLHAAGIAATLVHGRRVEPWWIASAIREPGIPAPLPPRGLGEPVLTQQLADSLRALLVATTERGTARRAFRTRRGRPLLGPIHVAGKTGSLSGRDPDGRYEWFIGVAPADHPRVVVATLVVQGRVWWSSASQVGASVLQRLFCSSGGQCRPDAVDALLMPRPRPAAMAASAP